MRVGKSAIPFRLLMVMVNDVPTPVLSTVQVCPRRCDAQVKKKGGIELGLLCRHNVEIEHQVKTQIFALVSSRVVVVILENIRNEIPR